MFVNTEEYLTSRLMILSVTRLCSLGCVYCRMPSETFYDVLGKAGDRVDLRSEDWPRMLHLFRELGCRQILLTGGEPLDYRLISDLLVFLELNNIPVAVHTNGQSRNRQTLLEHIRMNHRSTLDVHISVELFEDLQVWLRRSRLPLEFIRELSNLDVEVEAKIVLTKALAPRATQLLDQMRWWVENGVSSFRFQPVVVPGEGELSTLKLDSSCLSLVDEVINIKESNTEVAGMIRNSVSNLFAIKNRLKEEPIAESLLRRCNAEKRIAFVDTSLRQYTCKSLWGKDPMSPCSSVFDDVCCGFVP